MLKPCHSRLFVLPLALLLLLGSVSPAFALDMEFYTYGGFGPITNALQKVALIFSDGGYQGLFFTVTVLAILLSVVSWLGRLYAGANMSQLAWGLPVIFGVAVYFGLFVPKGSLTVYDPVLNRFETINNIPVGVVFTAGSLNLIERGLVEIIDTAGAPGAYQQSAGGIGFNLLRAATRATPKNADVKASLARYIDDCVTFELVRPGTTLSLDTLRNSTTNFVPELAKAVHPLIWTVYYDSANPEGVPMTCTEAWDNIQPIITMASFYDDAIDAMCGGSGFNPSSPSERTACMQLAEANLAAVGIAGINPQRLLQQTYLANLLYQFYYTADPELAMLVQANRQITTSGMGMAVTMNSWVPIMRAVMTAVAIGLIPFLALFLPSPLIGKALSVMVGFFVFLTTWGIADAIIHSAAMDHAVDAFADIRQSGLGVYTAMAFPEASTRIQAMFGIVRSSGIMLASFLTMMLIRFGGHALAMMAGSMQGAVQGAGSLAGRQLTTEGKQAAMGEQVRADAFYQSWGKMDEDFLNGRASQSSFQRSSGAGTWGDRSRVAMTEAQRETIAAAQQRGILPADVPPESLTGALHAQQSFGTGSGMQQVALDGRGGFAMMTGTGRSDRGWESISKTDGAGVGWTTQSSNAGMFSQDSDGNVGLARTAAGLKMDVTRAEETRAIEKGARAMAYSSAIDDQLRTDMSDSRYSSQARSFEDQVTNREQEGLATRVAENSGLSQARSEETGQTLQGYLTAGVGGGFIVRGEAGGRAQLQWQGSNGEKATFNLSEEQARAFDEQRMAARTEAIRETLEDKQQLSYGRGLAQRAGASEAHTYLNEAQNIQTVRAAGGVNAETAFLRDMADRIFPEKGGSSSPEAMKDTLQHVNSMATDSRWQNDLLQEQQSWLRGEWGNAGAAAGDPAVKERIGRTRGAVEERHGDISRDASPSMVVAAEQTGSITADSFNAPGQMGTLRRPEAETVHETRDAIRDHNTREMTGDGNVQTTIPGLAKNIGSPRQSTPGLPGLPPDATNPDQRLDINDAAMRKLNTENAATGERGALYISPDGAMGGTRQSMDMHQAARDNPFDSLPGPIRGQVNSVLDRLSSGNEEGSNSGEGKPASRWGR
ncbi:conjugal transfer protein TraG N-terminal domain-containing protein [Desulfurivibrio sp. D14AmB]|uniref:conjugal transfer protein TraG N-terminal domain-containing protein n=1 Tax=Desulfurivibrio sp. D14AmB TaxID=3374370 RepID=UPI00376F3752